MRTLGSWIYGFGTFQLLYSCHTYIPCPKMAQHSLNELVKMVAPPEKNDPLVVSELCYLAKWWVFDNLIFAEIFQLQCVGFTSCKVNGIVEWMVFPARMRTLSMLLWNKQVPGLGVGWKASSFSGYLQEEIIRVYGIFYGAEWWGGEISVFFCFLLARSQRNVTWIDGTGVANGQWFGWLSWHLKGPRSDHLPGYSKILLKIVTQ